MFNLFSKEFKNFYRLTLKYKINLHLIYINM